MQSFILVTLVQLHQQAREKLFPSFSLLKDVLLLTPLVLAEKIRSYDLFSQ